jgi:hypothetical protein
MSNPSTTDIFILEDFQNQTHEVMGLPVLGQSSLVHSSSTISYDSLTTPHDALFERALQLHRQGQMNDAEKIYYDILDQKPDHLGAIRRSCSASRNGAGLSARCQSPYFRAKSLDFRGC